MDFSDVTRLRIFPSSPSHIGACLNRGAVGECHGVGYEKRTAFDCFIVVVYTKRTAFSCPCVGAYCIRLTNDPFMGRMIQMIDLRCAFLSPAGPFCGAYAIRPYPDGRKMIAVGACSAALPEKRTAFWGCYGVEGGKCGAFLCLWVGIILRRRCGVFAVSKKTLHSPPLRQRS